MKIALPTAEGKLCPHFGHCQLFTIVDVDENTKEIRSEESLTPPPHEPGVLPKWLHELGADVIIAGGMGNRARQLFDENGIKVVVGASTDSPEVLVKQYLNDSLVTGPNVCDH